MIAPWPILYEDNHLLVVNKPALLPTMGVAADVESLLTQAKEYVKQKYQKPGNVYLGIVSRLDAPVTGVTVLARTSKAAARLTEQFREQTVEKIYWAVVSGSPPPAANLLNWVSKDERHRRMHIAAPNAPGAQEARLSYRVRPGLEEAASDSDFSLLEVQLATGRKHQIRLQLSHAGYPILGDRKYGSCVAFPTGIALHARLLQLDHPVRGDRLKFVAPLPRSWRSLRIHE